MDSLNNLHQQCPDITAEYEQKVLGAFRAWYRQTQPTIAEASTQARVIARNTVKNGLTTIHIIFLLQEHPDWTHQKPGEWYDSDKTGITISELARRHLVKHLEEAIQRKGFQAVCGQEQEQ